MSRKINVSYVVQVHEGIKGSDEWDDWAYDKAYFTVEEAEARIAQCKSWKPWENDQFRIVKRTEEVVDV